MQLTPDAINEALALLGWTPVPNKIHTMTKRMMWPPQGTYKTLQDVRILIESRGVRLALKERVTPTVTNPARAAWAWQDFVPYKDIKIMSSAQVQIGQHTL